MVNFMAHTDSEREVRILKAAAELISHYGYDKTTISEIAREASISKGAVYLHFDSKEGLFEALLKREMAHYITQWMAFIEADPRGGTIGGMYKNMLRALQASPFMGAIFSRDSRILGSYLKKPGGIFRNQNSPRSTRREFIELMQAAGAIRQDVDPQVATHIMNMLAFGLVSMQGVVPEHEIPPTPALIEGIADFMDRALSPPDGADSEAGKAILRQLIADSVARQTNLIQEDRHTAA